MWRVQTVDACVRLLLFALDRWVAPGMGEALTIDVVVWP
jgi:hypothetical protein